jgi:DNA polymerase elongation subunit (family B)
MLELNIQPYDWRWEDDIVLGRLCIKIWALTDKSESILVRIPYESRLYIELPKVVAGRQKSWYQSDIDGIVKSLDRDRIYITQYSLQKKVKFYYHQKSTTDFLVCQFLKQEYMYKIHNTVKYKSVSTDAGVITLIPREHNVDPCLNLRRRLGIRTTQWLTIKGVEFTDMERISNSKYEVMVDYTNKESIIPRSDEEISYITKPKLLSFDIECYSSNHNKMPEKYMSTDVVYIITCCIQRYLQPETQVNVCHAIGSCNMEKIQEEHPGAIVIIYPDELSLIYGFIDCIREYDPEVIIGYNIFSFDLPYLDARLKLTPNTTWTNCSRMKNAEVKIINKSWESSAYGRIETNFLECEGRICIDLFPHFKRNAKLDNYKLDTVAKHFLGESKFDMPVKKMFEAYKNFVEDPKGHEDEYTNVISYGIQDSKLPIKLFDKQIIWLDTCQMAYVANITPFEVVSRGISIRTYNLVMRELTDRNMILDERTIKYMPFDGGFVGKPKPNIWDNVVCLDFKSLYPSIIIAFNLCPTTFIPPEREYLYNLDHCWVFEWESEIDEKKNKKTKTLVEEILEQGGDEEDIEEEDEEDEDVEVKKKTFKHRYVFYRGGPKNPTTDEERGNIAKAVGVLPKILKELVDERAKITKQAAQTKDKVLKSILQAKANALKITANGTYGVMGSDIGKLLCKEVAIVTTYIGRTSIQGVNDTVEKDFGATVVYNDTDSSMFIPPGYSGEALIAKGLEIAEYVNGKFHPLVIECEKYGRVLTICPKKYVFWLYDKKGERDYKTDKVDPTIITPNVMYKGVVANRRDNSPWLRDAYRSLLDNILEGGNFDSSINIAFDSIKNLITRNVPLDKLVVTKQLRSEYKSETATMALFSSELSRRGIPAVAGERLPFIVVEDNQGREKIGYKMRILDAYKQDISMGEQVEPIDRNYYIEKGFMKPIQQLITVAYGEHIKEKVQINIASNIKALYNAILWASNGKYKDLLYQVYYTIPNIEGQIDYLTKYAPGRTTFKKLVSKHYNKHNQVDLRINDSMVKHFLKFQKIRSTVLTELYHKSYYFKTYYGDNNVIYPSIIKMLPEKLW